MPGCEVGSRAPPPTARMAAMIILVLKDVLCELSVIATQVAWATKVEKGGAQPP